MQENLWCFAVRLYSRPAVAPLYLAWQDRFGADINLLLAGFWLAAQRRTWSTDDVRVLQDSVACWRAHAVLPLRAARRALAGSTLYPTLKAIELDAERMQLRIIAAALGSHPPETALALHECTRHNLLAYAPTLPLQPDALIIDTLLATCVPALPMQNTGA